MDACEGNDGKRTAQQAAQDVKVQPIEVEQLMISDHVFSLVKGHMQEYITNDQPVAVQKLDSNQQPDSEFLAQVWLDLRVSIVSRLKHDNFVELLGYCVDGNSRILVFGFAQN
ncbi:hypothetical protein YC2023_044198 [Brassica napus]